MIICEGKLNFFLILLQLNAETVTEWMKLFLKSENRPFTLWQ